MKLQIFLSTVFLTIALTSCGKSHTQNNSGQIISSITSSKGWCSLELVDHDINIMTKFNIVDDKNLQMEKISIINNTSLITHKYSSKISYVTESGYLGFDEYYLRKINGQYEVQNLKGFRTQEYAFNDILSNNSTLSKSSSAFSPQEAIILKNRNGFSPDTEVTYYPCENYSSTFNGPIPVSPMIDYQILVGKLVDRMRSDSYLTIEMALQLPTNETENNLSTLKGTQWCKWRENKDLLPSVTILTIKDDAFKKSTYFGGFREYSETSSVSYKIDKSSSKLKAEIINDTSYFKEKLSYKLLKDASDNKFLIEENGEYKAYKLSDVYFNCSDKRPVVAYPAISEEFIKILNDDKSF